MTAQTDIDFINASIKKTYRALSKEESIVLNQKVRRAIDYLKQHLDIDTFKGLDREFIRSVRVLEEGFQARERFILANQPFVFKKVHQRCKNNTQHFSDMIQEGFINLARAVEKYDATTGFAFTTFAGFWILQSNLAYLRKNNSSMKISNEMIDLNKKIRALNKEQKAETGKTFNLQELSVLLEEKVEKIDKAMCIPLEVSLDEPESDNSSDGNNTKFDMIPAPEDENKSRKAFYKEFLKFNNEASLPLAAILLEDVFASIYKEEDLTEAQEERVLSFVSSYNNITV